MAEWLNMEQLLIALNWNEEQRKAAEQVAALSSGAEECTATLDMLGLLSPAPYLLDHDNVSQYRIRNQ